MINIVRNNNRIILQHVGESEDLNLKHLAKIITDLKFPNPNSNEYSEYSSQEKEEILRNAEYDYKNLFLVIEKKHKSKI